MSDRTNPYDIESVKGYPDALQIYRIPASRFWQVRLFVGRKYLRKSTKCEAKRDAIEFAKRFYDEVKIAERLNFDIHRDTFGACANHLMNRQKGLVGRGERDERLISEDRKKLDRDILPYFGTKAVADITTETLENYIDDLTKERKLSPSTLSKHLVVIRKVLNEARKRQFIRSLPPFPTITRRDNPRPYFDADEYRNLQIVAKELATKGVKVRYVPLDREIHDLIKFHVNVFVRISDIKLLKHRHVTVVKDHAKYLLIAPPKSKTVRRESVSMPAAVDVYEDVTKRHDARGLARADDYIFFPQFQNREYALQTMRRQFDFVLEQAGMKYDKFDKARTLYSLRHTALMLRLLRAAKLDIFMLARNALTSVDQLERFYLSHAESRVRIEELHSFKWRRRWDAAGSDLERHQRD